MVAYVFLRHRVQQNVGEDLDTMSYTSAEFFARFIFRIRSESVDEKLRVGRVENCRARSSHLSASLKLTGPCPVLSCEVESCFSNRSPSSA